MARTVSMSIAEFMNKEPERVSKFHQKITIPLATVPFMLPTPVQAVYNDGQMTKDVNEAFAPVFDLLRATGLPVAGIVLSVAAYNFMFAKTDRGWRLVFGAGIGYVILNLIPLALQILTRIGDQF